MIQIPPLSSLKPTPSSGSSELTDYVEHFAIHQQSVAIADCLRHIFRGSDEIDVEGVEDEQDNLLRIVDEIAVEIRRRIIESNGSYPFDLTNEDYVLQVKDDFWSLGVYKFLHYCTYLNMRDQRIHSKLDGAKLFELLSVVIAKNYLGVLTVGGAFGTSVSGGFRDKLQDVMDRMGEGTSVKVHVGSAPQDETIDVIVWKPFLDKRQSQLIAFGQCKTGVTWVTSYKRLEIKTILNLWFSDAPVVEPIPMFFCTMNFPIGAWYYKAMKIGLIFDRFRIMGLLKETDLIENKTDFKNIFCWVKALESWLDLGEEIAA
jgi:hypothetical protein